MSDKTVVYKEIIHQDRVYHFLFNGVILLSIILTIIFLVTNLLPGVISTGLTAIFLFFLKGSREKGITEKEFIIRFCFITFKTKLSDIDTVEIKDVSLLPEPYKGYVRFWVRDIKFFDGLRVLRLRDGDAVHIKTKKGQTTIVTPKSNQGFAEVLKKQVLKNQKEALL